jgi:hypothetical protein
MMADIIDEANDKAERDLELALRQRKPTLPFKGSCWNCDLPLMQGLFCDTDCRADWDRRQFQRQQGGRP